ncbi:LuxR C-terminal-related transcriptional regulator [Salininema proteolyticum]|uniref:LuxR C-terminal-related transcriptional regulator n=1 Tax=Salininema proteolyticum TaxID=1607685 RepID=A0ABV8U0W9_9ACTN
MPPPSSALPPSAQELYSLLVHFPSPATYDEASAAGALSREEFAEAVARLEALSLIEVRDGRLLPRSPETALLSLLTGQQEDLSSMMESLPALGKHFRHGAEAEDSSPVVAKLTGRAEMVRGLNRLIGGARRTIRVFEKPPFGESNPVEDSEESTLSRGVGTRVVYESSVLSHPDHMANLEAMAELGEESKVRDRLPFKMLLVDGSEAMIPLGGPGQVATSALHLRPSVLTDALDELFAATWELSVPAFAADESSLDLDSDERELLRLLATGIKDEAIARRLGVSTRTVSRKVNALLERMGSTNRFQAGVTAAKRGWI